MATDERISSGMEDILDRWTIDDVLGMYGALSVRDQMAQPAQNQLSDLFKPHQKRRR